MSDGIGLRFGVDRDGSIFGLLLDRNDLAGVLLVAG